MKEIPCKEILDITFGDIESIIYASNIISLEIIQT